MLTGHADLVVHYQRLRRIGLKLNSTLTKRLTRDVLDEGAKKLGFLKRGVFVFDSEDETSVLMDFCIHDVRRRGRSTIEDYMAEAPFPPGSDEMIYLKALCDSQYSIFLIENVEPELGVRALDVVRGERRLIVDLNFSRSARPGLALTTRISTPGEFSMTTGAALPMALVPAREQPAWLRTTAEIGSRLGLDHPSPERRSAATAQVIRAGLQGGAAAHVAYEDPGNAKGRGHVPASRSPAERIGRNDPCPCGSGRKFKKCCGAKK